MDIKNNRYGRADSFGKSDYKERFQNTSSVTDEEYIRKIEEEEQLRTETKRLEEQRRLEEAKRLEEQRRLEEDMRLEEERERLRQEQERLESERQQLEEEKRRATAEVIQPISTEVSQVPEEVYVVPKQEEQGLAGFFNNPKKLLLASIALVACIAIGSGVFSGADSNAKSNEIKQLRSQLDDKQRELDRQKKIIDRQNISLASANSYKSNSNSNSYSGSNSNSGYNSRSGSSNSSSSYSGYRSRYGNVTGSDVIIRASSTTNASVVGYLNRNDTVEILDKVTNNDRESAIFSREMYYPYNGTKITLNKGLAIKVKSDDGRQVTGMIKLQDGWHNVTTPRDSITYIKSSTWYHVRAGNKEGYVYGKYISER